MVAKAGLCWLAVTAMPDTAAAGAWLQPAGHWQLIMSGTFTASPSGFDQSGEAVDIADYEKFEFSPYFEYGVTDDITAIAQPQLRSVSIAKPIEASHTGLGYTDLGARLRLWSDDRSVLSAQTLVRIPGVSDENDPAQAGSTDTEMDIRLLYGRAFDLGPWPAFVDTQLGYRWRQGQPADQLRLDVTLGLRPKPDILLLAQSFNTFAAPVSYNFPDEDREHKIELSIVWDVTQHLSLQLGGIATIAGRNTLRERGVVAAAWWRF
jgi:hypothetical protein